MTPHRLLPLLAAALAFSLAGAVSAQAPKPAPAPAAATDGGLPDAPGKDVVVRVCTQCHDASTLTSAARTPDGWSDVLSKMGNIGAEFSTDDEKAILAYLNANLGKPAAP